jgi:hypothetical protein
MRGPEVLVEAIHQRNAHWNLYRLDRLGSVCIEHVQQCAERVLMCAQQDRLVPCERRGDLLVPIGKDAAERVLERLRERQITR